MVNHYQYGIQDIEQLYPFERDIYYSLLEDHVKEVNERKETNNAGAGLS